MIKYTRHAKRRMKLYNIDEKMVSSIVAEGRKTQLNENLYEFLFESEKLDLPIKVVSKIVNKDYLIITCYPLKRGFVK